MKMSCACSFIFMQIKVIFALRLTLKQRHKGTRKWLIQLSGKITFLYSSRVASRSFNAGSSGIERANIQTQEIFDSSRH